MHRRRFLQGALAAPMVGAYGSLAQAQAWPSRNITMIVAFPPGGQADLAARPVALALEKILGRSVVVDNRSGAGGMVGNAFAARAEPDGHTLLMALSSMTFLPEAERLYDRKPSYELDQFVPVARVLADPGVLCVRVDAPWKTVADLVADAKARPGQISFSSRAITARRMCHSRCSSRPPASSSCMCLIAAAGGSHRVIGKQVDITAQAPARSRRMCRRSGRLLANGAPKRTADYPRRADLHRARLQGRGILHLGRMFAPKGTPAPVIARLREAMREAMQNPQVTDVFVKAAARRPNGSAGLRKFVEADAKRLIPVIRKIGRLDEK